MGSACSEGTGAAQLRLPETDGIDNRIDNETATPPWADSVTREHGAYVAISPRFPALTVHVGRTLRREEREVSTTKRQRIDNCL